MHALRAEGVRVVGLGAEDPGAPSPLADLRAIATDTGAVDASGNPLVFDIGSSGDRVGTGIVQALETVASGLPLDVDAIAEDVPGDGYDATRFIQAVHPLSADPPDGVASMDDHHFVGVKPGTRVVFELVVDTSHIPPSPLTRHIPARIVFRAFARSRLGQQRITLVVPGTAGGDAGCAPSP